MGASVFFILHQYTNILSLLFVLLSLSAGSVVVEQIPREDSVTIIKQGPCDGVDRDWCTAKLGCKWTNNVCNAHIAWLHVMKCGSSFGTTLAHYANASLPVTSHIPSGQNQADPEDTTREGLQGEPNFFRFKYPINQWFTNVFRNPENPGNHLPILDEEWAEWRHDWFGVFRDPAERALSSYYHFGRGEGDLHAFALKIQGQQASMLSAGAPGFAKIRCEFNQSDAPENCKHMVPPDIDLAIRRLDGFAFVGILEEFDLSVCLFHKMNGSPCLAVEFLNTREGDYDARKQRELKQLRDWGDPMDEAVYDAAKRRFWGDVRKYDLKPSDCHTLCPDASKFKYTEGMVDRFNIPER